jgi:NAD(P)-dependent dehydrogenase (short-subunit alcohol dehydrogenase family)
MNAIKIELKGRKAIVTCSNAGIGRATAERLARAGASVVGWMSWRKRVVLRPIDQDKRHMGI